MWATLSAGAVWAALVAWARVTQAPFDASDSRALASTLISVQSARYLGACPLPLSAFFVGSLFARHLVAPALGVGLRAQVQGADAGLLRRLLWVAAAYCLWLLLCAAGATAVLHGMESRNALADQWAIEIALVAGCRGCRP